MVHVQLYELRSLVSPIRYKLVQRPTNLNSWPPHGRWKGVVPAWPLLNLRYPAIPVLKNAFFGTLARLWILKALVDLVHCLADLYPHWTAVIFQVQKILHCAAGTAILPCSGHNHIPRFPHAAFRAVMRSISSTGGSCSRSTNNSNSSNSNRNSSSSIPTKALFSGKSRNNAVGRKNNYTQHISFHGVD